MTSITKILLLSTTTLGIGTGAGFAINASTNNQKQHSPLMDAYEEFADDTGAIIPMNFSTADVLNWEPKQFADENYVRSKIPWRNYFKGDKLRHQQDPNNKLQIFQAFNEINLDMRVIASRGNNNFTLKDAIQWGQGKTPFANWEYADSIVTWDKDYSYEASLGIPSGDWIDTAHRNGVKVLPLIFQPSFQDMILKDDMGHYPYADQLIRMSKYYHLDGFFWNLEAGVGRDIDPLTGKLLTENKVAIELQQFFAYLQKIKMPHMEFTMYDSLTGHGGVTYRDELTVDNSQWLQVREKDDNAILINQSNPSPNLKSSGSGTRINDTYFLNYNWYHSGKLPRSQSVLSMLGRPKEDLYVTSLSANLDRSVENFFHLNDYYTPLSNSFGMFAPEMGMCAPKLRIEGCELHWQQYYRGAGGDVRKAEHFKGGEESPENPSGTNHPLEWFPAQSRYFVQHSTIVSDHFRTTFNTGLGNSYWKNGVISNSNGWHNLSSQDILPTYKYIVDGYNASATAEEDYSTAFEGGSSLQYKGIMGANSQIISQLYATKINLNENNKVGKITFQTNSEVDVNLALWTLDNHYGGGHLDGLDRYPGYYSAQGTTADGYGERNHYDLERKILKPQISVAPIKSETINGWTTNYYDLSNVNREIKYFGIDVKNNNKEAVGAIKLNIGEMSIGEVEKDISNDLPTDVNVQGMWDVGVEELNFHLDLSSGKNFDYYSDYYSIYQIIGTKEILLTKERDDFINLMHVSKEESVKIIVEKTDSYGNTARKEFEIWNQN